MNPIVNPLFFYFASVADTLGCIIAMFGVIALIILTLAAFICLVEYIGYEGDVEYVCVFQTSKKAIKWAMISSIILWTIFIFIPSKEVLIEMEVAKYATPDNIKSIVTEIVSTVKEMIN